MVAVIMNAAGPVTVRVIHSNIGNRGLDTITLFSRANLERTGNHNCVSLLHAFCYPVIGTMVTWLEEGEMAGSSVR